MTRIDIINFLIKENNYKSYIEIGVEFGTCINAIQIQKKYGIDPDPKTEVSHKMTSDDFFKDNKEKFDIIFIDGLHIDEQVQKDIENSLNALNEGVVNRR